MARAVFGPALDPDPVRVRRRKWFAFQPRETVMAPCGHLHFHPAGSRYSDDFSQEGVSLTGLFVHELTHVWQSQQRGRLWLPLMRHPFCRYDYVLEPGKAFERYGIEQQAEIVRHGWLARMGLPLANDLARDELERLLLSISTPPRIRSHTDRCDSSGRSS
ncbi:vgr related protein [Novosphingobium flavum]|uniref:vgr related protein n=1 Tax=Novosphingobium flavum TaxID=1778672 RepID=UPI001FEABCC4|nr:vgr related protein [Novosphingobium flavum]